MEPHARSMVDWQLIPLLLGDRRNAVMLSTFTHERCLREYADKDLGKRAETDPEETFAVISISVR